MRTIISHGFNLAVAAWLAALSVGAQTPPATPPAASQAAPIPLDQLGAVAGKQYRGEGLSVTATPEGARLRCAFQRLEGEVTGDGLWLSSTTGNATNERFRVLAVAVGRTSDFGLGDLLPLAVPLSRSRGRESALTGCAGEVRRLPSAATGFIGSASEGQWNGTLPHAGSVTVDGPVARFIRPGLTEEYSVSVDGVRQDFIVEQRPEGQGQLRVELDVTGAKAEPLASGAGLVLDGSGRKLAYARLRAVDAEGKDLTARLEVTTEARLAVLVEDKAAVYPVRIDPTFSDADWSSLGSGVNGIIWALAVSGSNLYVGGEFTTAGGSNANYVAK